MNKITTSILFALVFSFGCATSNHDKTVDAGSIMVPAIVDLSDGPPMEVDRFTPAATVTAVGVGSAPNDGTGDTLRAAMVKLNTNDSNLNSDKLEHTSGTATTLTLAGTTTATGLTASKPMFTDGSKGFTSSGTLGIDQGGSGAITAALALDAFGGIDNDVLGRTVTHAAPSLYFDGYTDQLTIADAAALSFTDGSGTDNPFSFSAWVLVSDITGNFPIISKYNATFQEYSFWLAAGKLKLNLADDSVPIEPFSVADTALTVSNEWVHVASTFTASSAVTAAANDISLYINGKVIAVTTSNEATYAGMEDGGQPLTIGSYSTTYAKGEIREAQIFNTALSASDVDAIYREGVPFKYSQASTTELMTDGDMELAGVANYGSAVDVTATKSTASPHSGTNALRLTATSAAAGRVEQTTVAAVAGKNYHVTGWSRGDGTRIPEIRLNGSTWQTIWTGTTSTSWQEIDVTITINSDTNGSLTFYMTGSGSSTEWVEFDDMSVVQVGAIVDLDIPGVNGTTVPDKSGNGHVATLTNMTVPLNAVNLPATISSHSPSPAAGEDLLRLGNGGSGDDFVVSENWTGTWTPAIEFGAATTGLTYSSQNGIYTKIGKLVVCEAKVTLTSNGSAAGAATITGLPFAAANSAETVSTATIPLYSGMVGLAGGGITGLVPKNGTAIYLYEPGVTDSAAIDEGNFSATSNFRIYLSYQTD